MDDRKEISEIGEEFCQLHTAWMVHCYEYENGANTHVHAPPALVLATSKIFESSMMPDDEHFDIENMDVQCVATQRDIIEFGTKLFEFGQRAARQGVLSANLTPCKCIEITDEEIANLMGEKHE